MAYHSRVQRIGALDAAEPFDIAIIGSGFSGTILGTLLARRQLRTLVVESGGGVANWLLDRQLRSLADYEVSGNADYPRKRTRGRLLGGNSNFWTGRCERLHPSDFGDHPYRPPDNPWPLTYTDLEAHYEAAEELLRVRGDALSEHMPPRRRSLPLPASTDIGALKALFAKVGVVVDSAPTATPRHGFRFFRLQNEVMPEFLASPHATLVANATVTRLLVDEGRRVTGVTARTLDGTEKTAHARVFVLACGGIENPRLLLLSRSSVFPNGIGNNFDRVGRGFTEHPSFNFYGQIRHDWKTTVVPRHKVGRIHQFYDAFRQDGLGSVDISVIQSWLFPHHLLPATAFVRDIGRVFRRLATPTLYMGPNVEMLPCDENRVMLSSCSRDMFGDPCAHLHLSFTEQDHRTLDRAGALVRSIFDNLGVNEIHQGPLTWSRHHIGACRMGGEPKTSVTDPDLRVHETRNLYVLGSETFVTGGAVTPVLTITALAHRLAEHLVGIRAGSE
jgi:choline dehydrogenase-like flavoprotein